ncbi:MAG: F420-0:Gamma-glutamyl ligase, partial [Cyanobacteria bacterium]|nr:F420-0:Gamma-glutamyl ligase [Cyanobacteria bacterium bin.275]
MALFALKLLLVLALLLGLTLIWLELRHRLRPASPLRLQTGPFEVEAGGAGLEVSGTITLSNPHQRMEVMVPEIELRPTLLGRGDLGGITVSSRIEALHPDEDSRPDGYWAAYIVKGNKSTQARIRISLGGSGGQALDPALLDTLWLEILWINYGPFGRLQRRDAILIPLQQPAPLTAEAARWRQGDRCRVLPVGTHLLGVLDDPEAVLRRYAGGLIQPGDVLTIGETPLAVMQGRYQHPANLAPSMLARLLCRVFHPTSSLATACGLQS